MRSAPSPGAVFGKAVAVVTVNGAVPGPEAPGREREVTGPFGQRVWLFVGAVVLARAPGRSAGRKGRGRGGSRAQLCLESGEFPVHVAR
jgi:hypothetical protein